MPYLSLTEVGKKFDLRPPGSNMVRGGEHQHEHHDEADDEYDGAGLDEALASHWALKGVTFSVTRGERVAIIGRNGSGKSTLLKIVGGLCIPTEGIVRGAGCVVPMNSIVQPFQPWASGIGNIRILCHILRIDSAKLQERLHEIIAFSELGERVHDRVSTYSSGMYERLAAAAALHLEPDILLIDGSFAVGDHGFRQKVDAKLRAVVEDGAILLYAGHKLSALQRYCDRAIWLDAGCVQADGSADEVFDSYSNLDSAETETETAADAIEDVREDVREDDSNGPLQIEDSSAFQAWINPPIRSTGPKLIGQGEGRWGNLLSFAVHAPDRQQSSFFEHPAQMLYVAVVETIAPNVTFDVQLDLWAGKAHAALARPAAPFHMRSPGRHRITASLDSDLLPDNIYSAKVRISFLDDSGLGQELALGTCDFFVSGKALRDERRRRFESLWPPKRLRDAFLTPNLDWRASSQEDPERAGAESEPIARRRHTP